MTTSSPTAALPATGEWVLDPSHTLIGFVARHLMFTKVRGNFEKSTGSIVVADSAEESTAKVTIETASLTTGDAKRDEHLRGADFFDVEKYPTITFTSTKVEPAGEGRFTVTGDLTIKDKTNPVVLTAEYLGSEKTPWGSEAVGVNARAQIDREEWGLTWNVALESGGLLVGKQIQLEIEAELVRPQ